MDLDGREPFPEVGLHTWWCAPTGPVDASPGPFVLALECTESITGEVWPHEIVFRTEWPYALVDGLAGETDLRLEYYADWGGFSIGPHAYSLRNADGELLIWARSFAGICDPRSAGQDHCDLANVFDEPLARPDPFESIVPVDDGCGDRGAWDGDFYPSHTPGSTQPEVVRRHALQFDDDDATLIHDGRMSRLTKAGSSFDAYVSSAHVAVTESGGYTSNVSLMLVRVP